MKPVESGVLAGPTGALSEGAGRRGTGMFEPFSTVFCARRLTIGARLTRPVTTKRKHFIMAF
jgi:hypothetical protein